MPVPAPEPVICSPMPSSPVRSILQTWSLLLPKEHGSWSLVLEPLALGLLAAPSLGGIALAISASAAFFARRPASMLITAGSERRQVAKASLLALSALAAAGLLAASLPRGWLALWPLLLCLPAGAFFVLCDLRGESRTAAAELAGSTAFALLPAAFGTLAGWSAIPALALAGLMLARSVPTVLLVRTCLRRAKGIQSSAAPALIAALAATGLTIALAAAHEVPQPAAWFAGFLLARTGIHLGFRHPPMRARILGWSEAALGAVYVVGIAIAYRI